jgi:hypothetical protein
MAKEHTSQGSDFPAEQLNKVPEGFTLDCRKVSRETCGQQRIPS